jgi:hypothetical protein
MKKQVLIRSVFGALLGLTISTFITILISAIIGDGKFHAVPPMLIEDCGGELNAVVIQAVCSMIYGAAWSVADLIWKMEKWSLTRQTITHLLVISLSALPISYLMHWVPRSLGGTLAYFGIFFAIYLVIWLVQYHNMKKQILQMNKKYQEK